MVSPTLIVEALCRRFPQISTWLNTVGHYQLVITDKPHTYQFLTKLLISQPEFRILISQIAKQFKLWHNPHFAGVDLIMALIYLVSMI